MKKGDYVRRLGGGSDLLTTGKTYRVKSLSGEFSLIVEGNTKTFGTEYFEPVKVAVHCKTKEEWNKVQEKAFEEGKIWQCEEVGKLEDWRNKDECIDWYYFGGAKLGRSPVKFYKNI